jgi:CMP-2-keto-3-deoxyoctulosonic acid synthetase
MTGISLHMQEPLTSQWHGSVSQREQLEQLRALFLQYWFKKEVARGGEQTRVLSISFIFSFSPFYR